jgi:hypothetical protein
MIIYDELYSILKKTEFISELKFNRLFLFNHVKKRKSVIILYYKEIPDS